MPGPLTQNNFKNWLRKVGGGVAVKFENNPIRFLQLSEIKFSFLNNEIEISISNENTSKQILLTGQPDLINTELYDLGYLDINGTNGVNIDTEEILYSYLGSLFLKPAASGGGSFSGAIPLTGTESGNPVTGNLEISADIILNGATIHYEPNLSSVYFGGGTPSPNTGTNTNAFGYNAGAANTGRFLNAFGTHAAFRNTGSHVNANGAEAARDNTGNNVNANGSQATTNNTGSDVNASGYNAATSNTGSNVNANGNNAGTNNTGGNVNANGNNAGTNNTFDNVDLSGPVAQADADKQQVFNNGIANTRWDYNLITANRKIIIPDYNQTLGVQPTFTRDLITSPYVITQPGIYEMVTNSGLGIETVDGAPPIDIIFPNPALFNGAEITVVVTGASTAVYSNLNGFAPYKQGQIQTGNIIEPQYTGIVSQAMQTYKSINGKWRGK